MQGKSIYAILLAIIAVLTLALAVMVIFLFTTYNNIKPQTQTNNEQQTVETRDTVPIEEQVKFNLYSTGAGEEAQPGEAVFNLKPLANNQASYLMASIILVYDAGAENKKLAERKELIEKNLSELKQACIEYFRSQTLTDMSEDSAIQKTRDVLKDSFNAILSGKSKEKVVIKIIIDKWNIQ